LAIELIGNDTVENIFCNKCMDIQLIRDQSLTKMDMTYLKIF
jgi:hypothetical protein